MGGRLLIATLVTLTIALQVRLWFGDGSVPEVQRLRGRVAEQQAENARLTERNRTLAADVSNLKTGDNAIEERARRELGMTGEGETFFQVTGDRDQH